MKAPLATLSVGFMAPVVSIFFVSLRIFNDLLFVFRLETLTVISLSRGV